MDIHTIVLHYSATYPDQDVTRDDIDKMHKARGFREIGYHWFVRRDGTLEEGRPENVMGAHVRGHNSGTLGICYAGGLDRSLGPKKGVWNPTRLQEDTIAQLIADIQKRHPGATRVVGHCNLVATQCPGRTDVADWWEKVRMRAPTLAPASAPRKGQSIWTALAGLLVSLFGRAR